MNVIDQEGAFSTTTKCATQTIDFKCPEQTFEKI